MRSTFSRLLVFVDDDRDGAVGAGFGGLVGGGGGSFGHFAAAPTAMASWRARDTWSVVERYSSEVR